MSNYVPQFIKPSLATPPTLLVWSSSLGYANYVFCGRAAILPHGSPVSYNINIFQKLPITIAEFHVKYTIFQINCRPCWLGQQINSLSEGKKKRNTAISAH